MFKSSLVSVESMRNYKFKTNLLDLPKANSNLGEMTVKEFDDKFDNMHSFIDAIENTIYVDRVNDFEKLNNLLIVQ